MRDSKIKLFELIDDMNTTVDMEEGGGLNDAYMTLSKRRRRSNAFAHPDATSAFANGGLPTIYRDVGGGIGDDYALAKAEYEAAHGPTDPGNVDPHEGVWDTTPELAFGAGQYVPPKKGDPAQGNEPLGYTNPPPTPFRSTNPNYLRYEAQQKINRETQGRTPEEIAAGAGNPLAPDMPYFTGPSLTNVKNFIARQKAEADLAKAHAAKGQAIADKPDPTNPVEVHFAKIGALGREASERGDPNAINYSNSILFEAAKMPGGIKGVLDAAHRGEYGQKAANLDIPQEVINQISRKTGGGLLPTVYRDNGGGFWGEGLEDMGNEGGLWEDLENIEVSSPSPSAPPSDDDWTDSRNWANTGLDDPNIVTSPTPTTPDTVDPDNFITNPEARYEFLYGKSDPRGKPSAPTFTEGGQFIYNRDADRPSLGPNLNKQEILNRLQKDGYTEVEYTYLNSLLDKGYDMKQAEDLLASAMATPGGLSAMHEGFHSGYSYGGAAGTLLDALERGTQQTLGIGQVLQERKKRREEDKENKEFRENYLNYDKDILDIIGEEIPKDKAEEVVGSNFLNFVGDLLGLERGEANILDKDAISQISAKAEEQGFTYKTPNSFASRISSLLPSKAAIPFTVLQNILPNKSVGTITSKKDGTTFSLNEDGSLTFIEDTASLNYDEGPDAALTKKDRPVKKQADTPTEEPPKTGMAALLARRSDPKKRGETMLREQDIFERIYNKPPRLG